MDESVFIVLTKFGSLSTVNVEWQVASLVVWIFDFKEKTIWTQFLLRCVILTLVVLVTLLWVSEEPVVLWTFESNSKTHCTTWNKMKCHLVSLTISAMYLLTESLLNIK